MIVEWLLNDCRNYKIPDGGPTGGDMGKTDSKTLAGLTDRRRLSRLSPHRKLICELRRSGATFGGIARFLSEKKQVTVNPSTVFYFIKRLEKEAAKPQKTKAHTEKPCGQTTPPPAPATQAPHPPTGRQEYPPPEPVVQAVHPPVRRETPPDDIWQKIEALKQRQPSQEPAEKTFDYDPDKPLTLLPKDGNA
jgi:hypothetical protein